MHEQREGDSRMPAGGVMKRRGLLAGAAALVAGIAAKRAAQPVGATHQPEDVLLGGGPNNETSGTAITWTGGNITSGAALAVADTGGPAPHFYTAMVAGVSTNNANAGGGCTASRPLSASRDMGALRGSLASVTTCTEGCSEAVEPR